jgi:hypothetical protein
VQRCCFLALVFHLCHFTLTPFLFTSQECSSVATAPPPRSPIYIFFSHILTSYIFFFSHPNPLHLLFSHLSTSLHFLLTSYLPTFITLFFT